jgi:hypothetical protein
MNPTGDGARDPFDQLPISRLTQRGVDPVGPRILSREFALIVNAKNSFRITRKTRFLKKAGFPDLSGKTFYHIKILH